MTTSFRTALLLLLLGSIFSLALIEIIFRLILLGHLERTTVGDRPHRYFYPEASHNMRDYFYEPVKPLGVFRMVVVGDSFTFGQSMVFDDAFPKRLERILNLNVHQPKVEVMNYGVEGYSTLQENQMVREVLTDYHPDFILLEITLNDPQLQPYRVTHPDFNAKMGRFELQGKIYRYWKSLGFVVSRIKNWRSHHEMKEYYFSLYKGKDTWDSFQQALQQMSEITKRQNVPLAAVVFPLFSYSLDESYPFLPLHKKTHLALDQLGIPYLDLFESYRGIPPERLQVFPGRDSHPNEIAHRIAAEAIYSWLSKTNFLPQEVLVKAVRRRRVGSQPPKRPMKEVTLGKVDER